MIYRMFLDMRDLLRERGFPGEVTFGPVRGDHRRYQNEIVIERAFGESDTIRPPRGQQSNPRKEMVRDLACVATVYARSSLPGAHLGDHIALCDTFVDLALVCLRHWGVEAKTDGVTVQGGQFIPAEQRNGEEGKAWPGVAYRFSFLVPRSVLDWKFLREQIQGQIKETAPLGRVRNRTEVLLQAAPAGTEPDTGCETPE